MAEETSIQPQKTGMNTKIKIFILILIIAFVAVVYLFYYKPLINQQAAELFIEDAYNQSIYNYNCRVSVLETCKKASTYIPCGPYEKIPGYPPEREYNCSSAEINQISVDLSFPIIESTAWFYNKNKEESGKNAVSIMLAETTNLAVNAISILDSTLALKSSNFTDLKNYSDLTYPIALNFADRISEKEIVVWFADSVSGDPEMYSGFSSVIIQNSGTIIYERLQISKQKMQEEYSAGNYTQASLYAGNIILYGDLFKDQQCVAFIDALKNNTK